MDEAYLKGDDIKVLLMSPVLSYITALKQLNVSYPWFHVVMMDDQIALVHYFDWTGLIFQPKIGCKQTQLDHMIRVIATSKAILPCNIVFIKIVELGIHL